MKGTLYKVDGTIKEIDSINSINDLKKIVGGHFELILLKNNDILILNDNGKNLKLPVNNIINKNYPFKDDFIVGDVLLIKEENAHEVFLLKQMSNEQLLKSIL